jgi:hypothetical protein
MSRSSHASRSSIACIACIAAAAIALLSACLASVEPEVGELQAGVCTPEDSDEGRDVSFAQDILPLFERMSPEVGCTCHLPSARRSIGIEISGLDLSSYSAARAGGNNTREDLIVPGDPCASVLVQKISSAPPFGARMPSNGPPYLSAADRALVADWIAEGAHDN